MFELLKDLIVSTFHREEDDIKSLKKAEQKLDEEKRLTQIKILLLGASESGKTTFVKQMRIINGEGYGMSDKENYIEIIYQNIFGALQSLISAMKVFGLDYSDETNIDDVEILRNLDLNNLKKRSVDQKVWRAAEIVWKDQNVQQCFERRREFHLFDNASFFLNNIPRIRDPNYLTTEQDILMSRVPTLGINEFSFEHEEVNFKMIDVGGQRNLRQKWVNCFEDIISVIFLAAISEYDQVLNEHDGTNRLQESIDLYRTLINSRWFQKSSFIVFLNKVDVLDAKIDTSDLNKFFPEYDGPKGHSGEARKFILEKFENARVDKSRSVYTHYTCATASIWESTESVQFVFAAVRDTILMNNLVEVNIS